MHSYYLQWLSSLCRAHAHVDVLGHARYRGCRSVHSESPSPTSSARHHVLL